MKRKDIQEYNRVHTAAMTNANIFSGMVAVSPRKDPSHTNFKYRITDFGLTSRTCGQTKDVQINVEEAKMLALYRGTPLELWLTKWLTDIINTDFDITTG